MREGKKPKIRKLAAGDTLTEQHDPGSEMYLLLDGVLSVEVDGEPVAEVGPGSILGERALIEGGTRTSTLRATTAVTVAVAGTPDIQPNVLAELASGHRREDAAI
jgi:CRP-like cAMP-binding protein